MKVQELILRALDRVIFDLKEYSSVMDVLNVLALQDADASVEAFKSIFPTILGEKFSEEELEEKLERIRSKDELYEFLLEAIEREYSHRLALVKSKRAKIDITHIALKRLTMRGPLSESLRELEDLRENFHKLEISDLGTLLRIYQALALGYSYLGFFDLALEYLLEALSISSITGNLPEILIALERVLNLYASATRVSPEEAENIKSLISIARSLYKMLIQADLIADNGSEVEGYIKDLIEDLKGKDLDNKLREILIGLEKSLMIVMSMISLSKAPKRR